MLLGAAFVLLITALVDIRTNDMPEDSQFTLEILFIMVAFALALIIYLSYEIFTHMQWKEEAKV